MKMKNGNIFTDTKNLKSPARRDKAEEFKNGSSLYFSNCRAGFLRCAALIAVAGFVFSPLAAQTQNADGAFAEPIALDLPSPELNDQAVQDVPDAQSVEPAEKSEVSVEKNDVIEVKENLSFDLPQNVPNVSESENAENSGSAENAGQVAEVVEIQLSDVLPDDVQNALSEINRELAGNKGTEKAEEDPSWEGWKITKNATLENPNRVEIATFEGKTASVTISGGFISDEKVAAIGRALDAAWLVPDLVIKSVSVYMEDTERFRFVLFPETFTYNDIDLCQFLPSGIAFSYSGALFYDVILKVGNVKPRLNGTYVEPADFAAQLYKGVMFPDMILEGNLQDRVARLEQALLGLASRGFYARPSKIDTELIQQVRMMYSENNLITKKEVMARLKEEGIKYTSAEIDTIFVVLLGVIE